MVCICLLLFLTYKLSVEDIKSVLSISNSPSTVIQKSSGSPPQSIQKYKLEGAILEMNSINQNTSYLTNTPEPNERKPTMLFVSIWTIILTSMC